MIGTLLCASTVLASAQDKPLHQMVHRTWQSEQGLPQNTILAIVQDRSGFLWLGTQDGLVRFDGFEFKVWNRSTSPELTSNKISTLKVSSRGGLWVGTSEGLYYFDDGAFIAYNEEKSVTEGRVWDIVEDAQGFAWVAIDGGGLFKISPSKIEKFGTDHGLTSLRVQALALQPSGGLWVGTFSGGLLSFDDEVFTKIAGDQILGSNHVQSLYVDKRKTLWVGTDGAGLTKYSNGEFRRFTKDDGFINEEIRVIAEDRSQRLWIGTFGGGLHYLDGDTIVALDEGANLLGDSVRTIFFDREDNFWVGTAIGLNQYLDGPITSFPLEHTNSKRITLGLMEDSKGAVWAGTFGSGLQRLSGTEFQRVNNLQEELYDRLMALFESKDGALWVGSWGNGVSRVQGDQVISYTTDDGLAHNKVRSIYQTKDETLWFGTRGGLSRFQAGEFQTIGEESGLAKSSDVYFMTESPTGEFWIGMADGIKVYKDGQFHRLDSCSAAKLVRSIYFDSPTTAWIATSGQGLQFFDGKACRAITQSQGLFDDVIYSVIEDDDGRIWMSCNRGIFWVAKSELKRLAQGNLNRVESNVYNEQDGMESRECNGSFQPAAWKAKDGRIWYPTVSGPVVVDPNKLRVSALTPTPMVEQVDVDGKTQAKKNLVVLQPGSRRLSLSYTAPTFIKPGQIEFQYQLRGEDPHPIHAGQDRVAYYSNLEPGDYQFEISVKTIQGSKNNYQSPLVIRLLPHYYQTLWFRVLLGIGLLILILAIIRLRVRHLRLRQAELEGLVQEQTLQIRIQNKEVEAKNEALTIAHKNLENVHQMVTETVLKRYVPPALVERILSGEISVDKPAEMRRITVLFSDLSEFTKTSEVLGPSLISSFLNEYLTKMNDIIFEHGGTVDKFIGDAVMVIFGAPQDMPDEEQAKRAVYCASAMQRAMAQITHDWRNDGAGHLKMRIGIHIGDAIVGNFGSDKRSDYTCIGPTVNIASRIESACKPGEVYVSQEVSDLVAQDYSEKAGVFKLKGIEQEHSLYRLMR